ncbi:MULTISPECIES: CDP-diacylglycerol--serine O-phosphatidyltransferase [unclassified Vibrio]|uniref:CDP-diacylglycerol--serine O-phosphatidyltransferase n=1 Tax=Vibrio sp. HB236076 TaxID=3232307 RepID=A0AB39HDS9_9VIBR|nr:CDP-diacylglycerol--serine O-phosphatidyltransferase [Vibrio sp. HB161653]MDP5255832.1 CDP-diacylglycerol--serine O-phosphatidyltransferase [Vibrio sp. HB161653]
MMVNSNPLQSLPSLAVKAQDVTILHSAKEYRQTLLNLIQQAKSRIYLVALYLEDDEAGREILEALYTAKLANPELDIKLCVDWHRAQRGLIGASQSEGNAAMYKRFAEHYNAHIPVYGIPVRGKEVFGVLHLKGFIFDDTVLYSGASMNNVYLHHKDKYRFDRYHLFHHQGLADCMVNFIEQQMLAHPAVNDLASPVKPHTRDLKAEIRQFRGQLSRARYQFEPQEAQQGQMAITPLVGLGKRRNELNIRIIQLIASAKEEVFICTPYFNFPRAVSRAIRRALKRGVKVSIVVGDKTANDFYISPQDEFKTIGGLPYLYELNLRKFAKANEAHIAARRLCLHLWKHDHNSFHLKGMWVDKQYMLITGNNFNPRAWSLDLENGLLINDTTQSMTPMFEDEVSNILHHTKLICTYKQFEKIDHYPVPAQRLIRKILRVKADRVLKRIL